MTDDNTLTLGQSLAQTYQDIKYFLLDHAPEILGAITLLLAGWLVAWLAQIAVRRMASRPTASSSFGSKGVRPVISS